MTFDGASVRAIAVSIPDVSDRSQPRPEGKWSQFFQALDRRGSLVDVVSPRLTSAEQCVNLIRSFRPSKAAWLAQAGFNFDRLRRVNGILERELAARRGDYQLIVQLQTLCSPRSQAVRAPYVIYTDNTMALSQRLGPDFVPLSRASAARWQRFEADVCREAERVFTCSEFARRSMISDYGCPESHVVAIGAGANQSIDDLDGHDYSTPVALFVGRDFDRKGGRVLLEAWSIVHASLPDAELVIAGPRKRPPIPGGIGISYVGAVTRDVLASLYACARAFVLPSLFEPWGLVFVEAMANGIACVGSDTCAMPEIIDDGVTGRIVSPGSPESLARALTEVLCDEATAREMGRAGYARAQERFTWAGVIDRLLAAL